MDAIQQAKQMAQQGTMGIQPVMAAGTQPMQQPMGVQPDHANIFMGILQQLSQAGHQAMSPIAQQLMQLLMQHKQSIMQPNPNGIGQNMGPIYTEPGVASVGGSMQMPMGGPQIGGTVGIDNGQPFGSYNVNGEIKGAFGPEEFKSGMTRDNYSNNSIGANEYYPQKKKK